MAFRFSIRFATFIFIGLVLLSCGASLTPEQREKARRAIEEGKIKRITPIQITEAALNTGKKISMEINKRDPFLANAKFIDSVSAANGVMIYALRPGLTGLSTEEASIAEAYQSQGDISGVGENVQRLAGDSLLYTLPVGNERPDGSQPFSHAIAIKMSVKQIVRSIKE